jgi:hypothetical protein
VLVRVASDEGWTISSTRRRRGSGRRRGLKWSSILADTQVRSGFGRGGSVEDLLGLGEDKWWERLLDRWEHLPDRLRTSIERGFIGALVVGVFLLLNLLMGMPLG